MSYVGAPYNFVPFSKKVRHYDPESLPGHDSVTVKNKDGIEALISGEITCEITARSDLFIGSGEKSKDGATESFYQDARGKFAIPGSTIRGLIRNNVQILSLSELGVDIDDYALMFRAVAGKSDKQKKRYGEILGETSIDVTDKNGYKNTISVLGKVRAGYISCNNGVYTIDDVDEPAPEMNDQKANYYILSERTVIHDYLSAKNDGRTCAYPIFFPNDKSILQHDNKREFELREENEKHVEHNAKDKKGKKSAKHYTNDKNDDYKPYILHCSYSVSGRKIIGVDKLGELEHEGYAVSTGKMNEHKAIYIIPARKTEYDESEVVFPITVPSSDIEAFKTDLKKRETTLKQFGGRKHFDLPEEGKDRPVFYIQDGGRLYFGFTPRLRLFYDHTIAEGIPANHKKGEFDYAKALFGYSIGQSSYKSRVSFSDAVIEADKKIGNTVYAILSEPKPTSYLDYVVQKDNDRTSYNDSEFELRGVKQYWLRDKAYSTVPLGKQGKEYVSRFAPLPQGTKFVGKIRFNNLKKEELGLLLWSISLNGRAEMNIGKAKSFGYGRISMNIIDAVQMDLTKAYALTNLDLAPWEKLDEAALISNYKEQLRQFLGRRPEDEESIKTLLRMKDPLAKPDDSKTRFMDIGKHEYQSRTEPLQKALDLTQQVKADVVYKAEVIKVEGKKISFHVLEADGVYGKFKLEDIVCREVSKKELKSLLPRGAVIDVRKKQTEDGEWECVKLPE